MSGANPVPSRSDRSALLYRLAQTFNSSLDLDEVLNRVIDEVIAAIGAERGFVMLVGPDGELGFRVARGLDQTTIEEPEFQISRGVVERVAREGLPILTSDAQEDRRISTRASVMNLKLRSILCVPLHIRDVTIGVIYTDNRLKTGAFSQDDLDLLSAIASSAAIAIENARLYQVAVEKGRMERELQVAYQVQAGLLPRSVPQLDGWEFAASWQPAREVAGDFYDFIPLVTGEIGLVIADVVDKGIPAALNMAFTRSVVRASLDGAPSPAEGIARANHLICADSTYGFFVTLFYAQLDPRSGVLSCVNAGHNPPLVCRQGEEPGLPGERSRLTKLIFNGMPLGVEPEATYEQNIVKLEQGDLMLFYTDGVTEAVNASGEYFDTGRLERFLISHCEDSAGEILSALEAELSAFVGPGERSDDVTMLAVRRS
jgi:serine phosphatase RsbU (regulator of sigma subunit)